MDFTYHNVTLTHFHKRSGIGAVTDEFGSRYGIDLSKDGLVSTQYRSFDIGIQFILIIIPVSRDEKKRIMVFP